MRNTGTEHSILDQTRVAFSEIVREQGLLESPVSVLARPLTPEEAIGTPGRRDFPIMVGKERLLEASFLGSRGHAFTDSAREFLGSVAEVLDLELSCNQHRAILIATMNAVLRHLGRVSTTVHCRDEEPERCGQAIAEEVLSRYGAVNVGLVGLNPAIADHLVRALGPDRVRLSDLCADQIGRERFGVTVWDGATKMSDLVVQSDVVLVTGTTLQNGTFDDIWGAIHAHGKKGFLYGVTAAGLCSLHGLERLCPYGRES